MQISGKLGSLEEKISREWGGINANHVPGYRYICVDHDSKICKASPNNKVATLTKVTLLESLGTLDIVIVVLFVKLILRLFIVLGFFIVDQQSKG